MRCRCTSATEQTGTSRKGAKNSSHDSLLSKETSDKEKSTDFKLGMIFMQSLQRTPRHSIFKMPLFLKKTPVCFSAQALIRQ